MGNKAEFRSKENALLKENFRSYAIQNIIKILSADPFKNCIH